jgi:hypothetical protein
MSRHCTHSAKPDTLVCTLPEPWLYRAGRRGDAITDLRYVEAQLRTNPSLHHIHVADSVRSAETFLSHAGITRSSRALRVLDLTSSDGIRVALARFHGHHAVGMDSADRLRQNISTALGVHPLRYALAARTPLPSALRPRQCRFDVALAYLPKWTFDDMSDWEFLLRDLACHHMAHNATIHLELPIAEIVDHPNGLKALATRFGHLHRIRSYAASGRLSPAADIHAAFTNLQPFRSDCRHLLR